MKIAILGYGKNCKPAILKLADEIGIAATNYQDELVIGGYTGVFSAVRSHFKGVVNLILERHRKAPKALLSNCTILPSTADKHTCIASMADGAVVIGGGDGSIRLMTGLLSRNKPIVCIKSTGGAADNMTDSRLYHAQPNASEVLQLLHRITR